MEDFFLALVGIMRQSGLFLFGETNLSDSDYPYLIFSISTASVGLLAIMLDFVYYKTTKGKSLFKLAYIGASTTFLMFFFWGIGSGIIGFFASRIGLLALTIQSSLIVALVWPVLFPKLYKYANSQIETEEIEEVVEEE